MSITKNVLLCWYCSMEKKKRKIPMIFDIENWLWKSKALFDTSPLHQFSKFNNFLWLRRCLGKNLSNFVPPAWKLDNSYYHTMHNTKLSINRFAMVSQSLMVPMEIGDQFYVLLHEGALKGGGISHTFTSLNGHKIATMALPEEHNDLWWDTFLAFVTLFWTL